MMDAPRRSTLVWIAATAGLALAAISWFGREPAGAATAPSASSSAASSKPVAVYAGQVYPDRLVLLQRPDEAASAPVVATELSLLALHQAGAQASNGAVSALRTADPGPMYPVVWAAMPLDSPITCKPLPAAVAASAPPAPASGPRGYVAHDSWQEFFDPGMPDRCESDDDLLLFQSTRALGASFPVLGVSGLGPLTPDYAVAGQLRPLSDAERAAVQRDTAQWRAQFRQAYGKDFNAADSPSGEPATLAQAQLLAIWRDAQGHAVLRAASWERVSVGQHLYRVLVIDHLDGEQVRHQWQFTRHLGAL